MGCLPDAESGAALGSLGTLEFERVPTVAILDPGKAGYWGDRLQMRRSPIKTSRTSDQALVLLVFIGFPHGDRESMVLS
jgi:hypothetical protein